MSVYSCDSMCGCWAAQTHGRDDRRASVQVSTLGTGTLGLWGHDVITLLPGAGRVCCFSVDTS
jgi:hypothetical protein